MKYLLSILFLLTTTLSAQYSLRFAVDTDPGQCTGRIGINLGTETGPYKVDLVIMGSSTVVQSESNAIGTIVIFQNVCEGTYLIRITDSFGCVNKDLSATIAGCQSLSLPNPQSHVTNSSDCNSPNGTIDMWPPPFNNSSGFTWNWSTGSTSARGIENLSPGTYILTITEETGCASVFSFNVPGEVVSLSGYAAGACQGINNGEIEVDALFSGNGSNNYTYEWNNGATSNHLTNLNPGTFCVTVTHVESRCQDNECFEVESIENQGNLSLGGTASPSCIGMATGSIVTNVFGGSPPYTYQWNIGNFGGNQSYLEAGNYTITATDYCGNVASEAFEVEEFQISSLHILELKGICGGENGVIHIGPDEGDNRTYDWYLNGVLTKSNSMRFYKNGMSSGSYEIEAIDQNGCPVNFDFEIEFKIPGNQPLEIILESFEDINCYEGFIHAGIRGGTAPYTSHWEKDHITVGRGPHIDDLNPGRYILWVEDYCGNYTNKLFNLTCYCEPLFKIISNSNDPCKDPFKVMLDNLGSYYDYGLEMGATYNFTWNDGDQSSVFVNAPNDLKWTNRRKTINGPGTVTVRVQDQHGCEQFLSKSLNDNPSTGPSIIAVNNHSETQEDLTEIRPSIFNTPPIPLSLAVQTSCMNVTKCGSFITDYSTVQNLKFYSKDSDSSNPCQAGGDIFCEIANGKFLPVPQNNSAVYWQFEDDRCGCLFPEFLFQNQNLINPIYIEMPCDEFDGPPPGDNDPEIPVIDIYEEDFCQCNTWCNYVNLSNGTDCGYQVFCAGSNTPIKTVYLSEADWYECTRIIQEDDGTELHEIIQVWMSCPTDPCLPGSYWVTEYNATDIEDDHPVYDIPLCINCDNGGPAFTTPPDQSYTIQNSDKINSANIESLKEGTEIVYNKNSVVFFPNPLSSQKISILSPNIEIQDFYIIDLGGRKIENYVVELGTKKPYRSEIIFSKRPNAGIYFIHIKSTSGEFLIEKLIVL